MPAEDTALDVTPLKDSALFFRHGFASGSVRHVGCRVNGPVAKYLAHINVMYESLAESPRVAWQT